MDPIGVLSELIAYPTITPQECGIYTFIQSLLPDFESLHINAGGRDGDEVKNLFLFKRFGQAQTNQSGHNDSEDGKAKPLHFCFAGHIDVVPPGNGWQSDPFVPEIRGEYLYGRGAQDMKGGVSAFLCALRDFLRANTPKTPVIFSVLLTSDEEGSGTYGTKIVLEALKQKGLLPDMAIVAEPTCDKRLGDTIKIGRRGSINGIITIKGIQGHVAYPEKCHNPVELLGARLGELAGVFLDDGDEDFAPSKLVITDIRGGMEAVNVTPSDLKIMFNVRNSTKTHLSDVRCHIENVLDGLPYDLDLKQSSYPFLTSSDGALAGLLQNAVHKTCGVYPEFSTGGGTSDARHFSAFGVEVIEFGTCNDKIHSVDECVNIRDLNLLYETFMNFLSSLYQVQVLQAQSIKKEIK
ncbi:succinyl-diaminopimelate desuccinylase [Helicobacter sp. 11S02596-1]|uniref:succinyl-diaminopimelate desuccinylase n=1 Tax=Helicobacter sp. 11S02596-1 TaxID=1476194 RepID=UPI000BA777B6|nr:succinyl-diaminopimelate desuccinylase [Helicobacter sp. 11S02596-1]PAF41428.1 succinyl-diaminopimelate desuccinylase [Helicobacter sp. 11S02596-1]